MQRIVAEEVLQLAGPYRTAVLTLHFEGVTAEEFARGLGIPGATVRSWSKRGLETSRMRLDKRFGGERSACLLSFARPEVASVPVGAAGGITGRVIVKKFVAAAAAVALLANVSETPSSIRFSVEG